MKQLLLIIAISLGLTATAQETELLNRCKAFHLALTSNISEVSSFLDEHLSYGHSNGWLENKEQMLDHLNTKMMVYKVFSQDSTTVTVDGEVGYLRFNTQISASLNGNDANFKLKVLEVWRKKNGVWLLLARQAIRLSS